MLGIDKELINRFKAEDRLINYIIKLPKYCGLFNSKREMEEKSAELELDIGLVRARTQRLRKGKPDVFMQYIKVKEGFEKIGRYKQIKRNYSPTKIK